MKTPLLNVLLYQPEIPQNTGNIGRLCVGTGARLHLVKPLGFDLTEKRVRRAGLDYWPHLDLSIHEKWSPDECPGRFFLFSKKVEKSVFDVKFEKEDWLVFGSEAKGLPESWLEKYEKHCLCLPHYGPIRSHNLSNTVSAAAYLALRSMEKD